VPDVGQSIDDFRRTIRTRLQAQIGENGHAPGAVAQRQAGASRADLKQLGEG
jgi:hypothetical protein